MVKYYERLRKEAVDMLDYVTEWLNRKPARKTLDKLALAGLYIAIALLLITVFIIKSGV